MGILSQEHETLAIDSGRRVRTTTFDNTLTLEAASCTILVTILTSKADNGELDRDRSQVATITE
jgi:hypothetical protein